MSLDVGDGEELDERDDERPVDREVGPADLVGEAADERGEAPIVFETTSRYKKYWKDMW